MRVFKYSETIANKSYAPHSDPIEMEFKNEIQNVHNFIEQEKLISNKSEPTLPRVFERDLHYKLSKKLAKMLIYILRISLILH